MTLFRLVLLCFLAATKTSAANGPDFIITDAAERHARQQLQSVPGKVSITITPVDVRRLPPCSAYEAFTPPGARLIGRTQIGVRCLTPGNFTLLVAAQIAVSGNYVTTSRPLRAGQVIEAGDLIVSNGDIGNLPNGFLQDATMAVGKTLRNSIGAGQILRSEQLLAPLVIRQGQTVKVISAGSGFSVSAEGKALGNASAGQLVQVRMNSGQVISGMARADSSIEITF